MKSTPFPRTFSKKKAKLADGGGTTLPSSIDPSKPTVAIEIPMPMSDIMMTKQMRQVHLPNEDLGVFFITN